MHVSTIGSHSLTLDSVSDFPQVHQLLALIPTLLLQYDYLNTAQMEFLLLCPFIKHSYYIRAAFNKKLTTNHIFSCLTKALLYLWCKVGQLHPKFMAYIECYLIQIKILMLYAPLMKI